MPAKGITHLIINSPYEVPKHNWRYHRETQSFTFEEGRRPAGYVIASGTTAFDDPGRFIPIDLVNKIRPRVETWRKDGYAGVTGITRRLLEHWYDEDRRTRKRQRFFFCQLEAIETLIWLTEAPPSERVGIAIPSDGGAFHRLCCKMATGSGKTVVMAKLIAWQVLNKVAYPQDDRFSKHIFVVAPGLTVKTRLQVLYPAGSGNYYDEFDIVPGGLRDQLRQGKVLGRNWHALNWETEEKFRKRRSVDKRGAKSDEAYVRDVLQDMAKERNILVINDEAHHAWRVNPESKKTKIDRALIEEATKWVGGLDRIHKARGILRCFDFSATPFSPSGKQTTEEALFGWIVSDFGLNDAIESGLVKTPRIVVRDDALPDAKTYKSKLYHIYEHVRDDLSRSAEEFEPLPDLVMNAYLLLGKDWLATQQAWKELRYPTPPVMISVANRTETAARVKHAFDKKKVMIDELCKPDLTLHIDSKVLDMAEAGEEETVPQQAAEEDGNSDDEPKQKKLTKDEQAKRLRLMVDKENLLAQVIRLVETFITSPKLEINPPLFYRDEVKRRVMLTLNMQRIIQHVFEQIRFGNTLTLEPVFDSNKPIRSTEDMLPWFTGKPCVRASRSHINFCVADSTPEAQTAYELDINQAVAAWAKNDHLGFEVAYIFAGVFHKFRPDYLIRLAGGVNRRSTGPHSRQRLTGGALHQ